MDSALLGWIVLFSCFSETEDLSNRELTCDDGLRALLGSGYSRGLVKIAADPLAADV